MATGCTGPSSEQGKTCGRRAIAEDLCATHYQQALRCRARGLPVVLKPINPRGDPRLPLRIRLRRSALAALGPSPGERAREILEEWAAAHPAPPPTVRRAKSRGR